MKCPVCGTEMVQKNRPRLLVTGILFLGASGLAYYFPNWWPVALLAGMIGLYLFLWGTIGKGQWCRTCKTFRRAS